MVHSALLQPYYLPNICSRASTMKTLEIKDPKLQKWIGIKFHAGITYLTQLPSAPISLFGAPHTTVSILA